MMLCILFAGAVAENDVKTFAFISKEAGEGERLLLTELNLELFCPEGFKRNTEQEKGEVLYCFEQADPEYHVLFLKTGYASLEEAVTEEGKQYEGIQPISVKVNGMDGAVFAIQGNTDGVLIYVLDGYLQNKSGDIINYYEYVLQQENLAKMLPNVMPASEASLQKAADIAAKEPEQTESGSEETTDAGMPKRIRVHKEGSINVRKEPDPNGERVGAAAANKIYDVISMKNGWYLIEIETGATGYVSPKVVRELSD